MVKGLEEEQDGGNMGVAGLGMTGVVVEVDICLLYCDWG